MLNAGILSSSSSLVLVPDLTGLDTLQANSLIQNLQFTPTTSTTTATGATSSNNGLIASQSLAPNTLAERYTTLSYVTYAYVAPPPPPPAQPPPPSDPSYYWISACCGTGNLKAEASSTVSFADALAIASSLCPVALSNVQQTYGPSAPSITCGSTPPPPEPPPGNVCGTACGNCIDFGGQWVFTSSTGSDGYCNYPPPPPPPSSVTCSFVGIVGASFFDCPSGQAEQYSCTNGVSYTNCI